MRYLSVCSGIEAVSVAWGSLGWQPAMFAEIDPFCCWLLRLRYRASRPIHMPSPHDAPGRKEAKRRVATIAFTLHGSDGTAHAALATEVAGSLRTRAPGSIENSSTTAVLQEQPVAWSGELTASTEVAGTLQHGGEGGRIDGVMTPQMAVRRLTPRECERLQGFPDDYTLVEYRGKLAADGPRYKALGNSMAVPVMRWIGERIAAVDAILRDRYDSGRSR
jgi:DNA (cytosine-5)-methyltransferase 1